jgi:superfamily II DNA/RNA helicase
MDNFTSLNLPTALMKSLERMQFHTPTPIQAQAIPPALEGRDILGSAQTGTGKTGAFGIPMIAQLMGNSRGSALVMTPTRELAVQVLTMLEQLLGKPTAIKTALLIGGDSMPKQLQQLRLRPRLIVGTPGRINDHLERGSLMLHDTRFLVLDETDRMLDMGFSIQIERILKFMPQQRQTLLFSATLPQEIVRISEKYLKNPVRVAVGQDSKPAPKIKQEVKHLSETEKYATLTSELHARNGSIIVFVKTKWGADKLALRLRKDFHSAEAIHGDLRQNARDRVIAAFRNKKHRILVATDIAARGLDIPHIEHVINFDLPQCPEDYIHRIGRTARAGAEGSSLCLISSADTLKWNAILKLIDPEAAKAQREAHGAGRPHQKKAGGGRRFGRNGNAGGAPKEQSRREGGRSHAGEGKSRSKPASSEARAPRHEGTRHEGTRSENRRSDGTRGEKPATSHAPRPASRPAPAKAGRGGSHAMRRRPTSSGGRAAS